MLDKLLWNSWFARDVTKNQTKKLSISLSWPLRQKDCPSLLKNQLTEKWRTQEIREIFVTLVLVRSRKYFQSFCFSSCHFFFIKELVGHRNRWEKG